MDDFGRVRVKKEVFSDTERDLDGDFSGSRRQRHRRSRSRSNDRDNSKYSRVRVKKEVLSDDSEERDADGDFSGSRRRRSRSKDRDRSNYSRMRVKQEVSSDNGGRDVDGDFSGSRRRRRSRSEDKPSYSRNQVASERDADGDFSGSRRRPRSRSRSRDRDRDRPRRRPDNRDRDNDRDRNQDSNGRKRDPVREKEWDNFFHPKTQFKTETGIAVRESDKYGKKDEGGEGSKPKVEKEKPNFGLSGKLTEETNTFRGVVIKYSEPPEARKPQKIRWRLYPFKGEESLDVMYIHRQSAYLLGRDRKIADIPIDHPSCSKQHAVIQYRLQPYTRADGTKGRRVKPYIIDLESANGTYVNANKIDPKRYVELFEKDVLKFGFSSREYVLLNEHSKDESDDDEEGSGASPLPDEKKKDD